MDLPPANPPPTSSLHFAEPFFSDGSDDPSNNVMKDREREEQEDIYRGEPPSPPSSPTPRPPSVASLSSSSSGWSGLGLRRGALGAVLELAINRWARSSGDSSTSSSSSSSSTVHTRLPRRRTRRPSIAASHNTHSENVIRARRRAWEESRVLPREFALFLPAALAPQAQDTKPMPSSQDKRVFSTSSLPLILTHLDSAIKRSAKLRKPKQHRAPSPARTLQTRINDYMLPEQPSHNLQADIFAVNKGKGKEEPRIFRANGRSAAEKPPRQSAWWLDVSNPTWSDLREIGKLLHLHPLTLEDILHQDPREKLELFSRLGYYFVVFRALESERTRSKAQTQLDLSIEASGDNTVPFSEGTIGATNVYIVVFREGICTFHFEDISNHTSRVRSRIVQLEEIFHFTSDWIAHGILDSIVDQFFPLLNSIELEVKELDDLVLSIQGPIPNRRALKEGKAPGQSIANPGGRNEKTQVPDESAESEKKPASSDSDEVPTLAKPLHSTSSLSWTSLYIRRIVAASPVGKVRQWQRFQRRSQETAPSPSPLMRMASTRRLVTSLTRLLGTKSEVVSQIRKRLTGGAVMGSEVGPSERARAAEVGIYLGDIQDHILTLQQSLAHYERMLSHSHPTYLSQLRVSLSQAKGGMDKALFMLTVISVVILAMTVVTGMFSMNLGSLPRNNRAAEPPAPFNAFGSVVVGVVLAGAGVVSITRYWWLHAKRKYARRPKF